MYPQQSRSRPVGTCLESFLGKIMLKRPAEPSFASGSASLAAAAASQAARSEGFAFPAASSGIAVEFVSRMV